MSSLLLARARGRTALVVAAVLLASLGAMGRAFAAEPPIRLVVEPLEVRADDRGMWSFQVSLENHTAMGLYPDSLVIHWTSETQPDRAATTGDLDLSGVARAGGPASSGEQSVFQLSVPSEFVRGSLTLTLRCHDMKGNVFAASQQVEITGSALEERAPSELLQAGGRTAELVIVRPDSTVWPAPALLVLPRAGVRARSQLRWALRFVSRGYVVALLGPPGAGASAGPDDHSGPASVAAVHAALERLKREPSCSGKPVLLWGEGRGATTALLAAAGAPQLAGVVALDASYDPWAEYRALPATEQTAFVAAAGRDSAAWSARSPIEAAARIAPPLLVVHTDLAGAPGPVRAFVDRRSEAKLTTEARINGAEERPVRQADAMRLAMDFLTRRSGSRSP